MRRLSFLRFSLHIHSVVLLAVGKPHLIARRNQRHVFLAFRRCRERHPHTYFLTGRNRVSVNINRIFNCYAMSAVITGLPWDAFQHATDHFGSWHSIKYRLRFSSRRQFRDKPIYVWNRLTKHPLLSVDHFRLNKVACFPVFHIGDRHMRKAFLYLFHPFFKSIAEIPLNATHYGAQRISLDRRQADTTLSNHTVGLRELSIFHQQWNFHRHFTEARQGGKRHQAGKQIFPVHDILFRTLISKGRKFSRKANIISDFLIQNNSIFTRSFVILQHDYY